MDTSIPVMLVFMCLFQWNGYPVQAFTRTMMNMKIST